MGRKKLNQDDPLTASEALANVRWEYRADRDKATQDVSTGVFFLDFPWQGEESVDDSGEPPPPVEDTSDD